MERNSKTFTGRVVSDKTDKTIPVLVETYKVHPLYGKRVKYSKKYATHDELNEAKVGDVVRIQECRPMSKTKKFRLVEVVEKAVKKAFEVTSAGKACLLSPAAASYDSFDNYKHKGKMYKKYIEDYENNVSK